MRAIVACTVLLTAGLIAGCGANRISGDHIRQRNVWYGTLGIMGDYNDITVARESRLIKLSILGHHNEVTVEDGVTLNKIEIFGDANTIRIPDQLIVRVNQAGKGNQILRYGPGGGPPAAPASAPQPPAREPATHDDDAGAGPG